MKKIKIGIVGGAGYTGGELLRILVNHPNAEIVFVHSKSNSGKFIHEVHTDLIGDTNLKFAAELSDAIDVLILCIGHGEAKFFLAENNINEKIKIIDLSQDFRLEPNSRPLSPVLRPFVYGLPELNRNNIKTANNIANPGCFATCLQLALLPLAAHSLLKNEIHISATTGSTGAGQSLSATSHFSWRQNNLSIYKAFEHQHLAEVGQSLNNLQKDFKSEINFIPYRGSFTRGIIASVYTECTLSLAEAKKIYQDYYETHPFVYLSKTSIDLKQVMNTNKGLLHLEKHGNKLLITSVIDNLLKGASGQAVQNMNLMFGLEEMAGLKLKAVYF
ncbi:MAG: N-acetyl-gamma-glutamyl-phosphate reductase [Bacteroidetes bacterium]|nr:N-acetyl-gamma-glutamyl-phosphate reductase [Bacteroidota bacterium]